MRQAPDFFIIGAMKAGSTSLWHQLRRHPEIFLCTPKEPQYFSRGKGWCKGASWYQSLFDSADPRQHKVCGEASTCYTRYPHFGDVPGRIKSANPRARFVYILRDPVDRVYSHYLHASQRSAMAREPIKSFRDAWRSDPEYLNASRYILQIEHYLRHFDRDRLFLCTIDDLKRNPESVVAAVAQFLGLEARPLGDPPQQEVANKSLSDRFADRVARSAVRGLRLNWVVSALATAVPRRLRRRVRDSIQSTVARRQGKEALERLRQQVSPFAPEDRVELLEHLGESIEQLQAWWGRDLTAWMRREIVSHQ